MSIAQHLEELSAYGAMAVRLVPSEGEPEDMVGEGGGLSESFERLGRGRLVDCLADRAIQSVLLADNDLQISVSRVGDSAVFKVQWGEDVIVEEDVALELRTQLPDGPVFRPDPESEVVDVAKALHANQTPLVVVQNSAGQTQWFERGTHGPGIGHLPMLGQLAEFTPDNLGDEAFCRVHGVRWPYVAGAMAGGIASAELVIAMGRANLLSFFGTGGLPLPAIETALKEVTSALGTEHPWGFNLLHNPNEPAVEEATVDLFLKYGVPRVSASAYMGLSEAVVRYRLQGIHAGPDGEAVCPNQVFAKISRPEVAEKFLRPAPASMLKALVARGVLTADEMELARHVPIAEDISAEADSGGHTDHRPALVLLPVIQRLRDQIAGEQGYASRGIRPRIGLGGGIGTPSSIWAAFSMGADYVFTGSVNQATVEAGTSDLAKDMLAQASYSDVASGPAPDMFELGAKVQVLSRGSMYAQRSQRLYDLYKAYGSMEEIPAKDRQKIEKQLFKRPLAEVWEGTREYWAERDSAQVARAEKDPRHKMALTFRWYLGMTSRWARMGDETRKRDFQVWCGPAMGGFNEWVQGSRLEAVGNRTVVGVAEALMTGASIHARIAAARAMALPLPLGVDNVGVPEPLP